MMIVGLNNPRRPPYKLAGLTLLIVLVAVLVFVWLTFRGALTSTERLLVLSSRSGLVLDPGAKVTFNGVQIGQVASIEAVESAGESKAQLTLAIEPRYIELIPANVDAQIRATTVFGNKYVAFDSPDDPEGRLDPAVPLDASHVTTEFNTLFESVMDIAEHVDPIRLNATLTAAAEALDGLGDRFGQSLVDGNETLTDLNDRMPQIRYDNERLAGLTEIYADASPDLWEFLRNSLTTLNTLNSEQSNLDSALLAVIGFSTTGADLADRSAPYLIRGTADLGATAALLHEYRGMIFCTFRNFHDVAPRVARAFGGANGYSLSQGSGYISGAPNPYIYPDNLPRANARGGPAGKPGCWAPLTKDLWPGPYLVMDTGASIAPYNHLEIAQPLFVDYVWGRQIGEYTINP